MTVATHSPRRSLGVAVKFGVLGPVTVTQDGAALNIGGPKQRTVLALLVAYAGSSVSTEAIIDAVWGEEAGSNARRVVQTYVATLRAQVGDTIVRTGNGWRLDVGRDQIDAASFEDMYQSVREVAESNPQRASVALREALAIWRGHPYADVEAHGALDGEISRLTELRIAAQAGRIDADLALRRDADLVGEIEALMAQHPYSERFRAQHMLALYRAGRQQEALRSYQQMRALLLDELGVDPTPELQDLEARILDQDDSLRVTPAQTIQRKAILVADPGDPIEIGHLPGAERDELLERSARAVQRAIEREGDGLAVTAGTTTYVLFDNAIAAVNVAESVVRRLDGEHPLRMAVDWGDLLLEDDRVVGPPVSRAAILAAVAHKGQVLLSADAQQAIGTSGSRRGLRFESLGSYDLPGVEGSQVVYQLLVGEMPPVFPDLQTHRLPPPLPGGGDRSVPGYELREPIGPGSVGTLYRAFQPSVGREVLIEVIGRADSSGADFIRNFEADAQRLSLLDHQNIAAVIDYWRQPDGSFLVYRFPRGGLLAGRGSVDRGRIVEQVGSALFYAHSLDIVHGSLRPDRIALDEAGNASVLGFPVAGVIPRISDEYLTFVAAEIHRGGTATTSSDVYSLAVLARDLGWDAPVIDRATSDDPAERPSSVAEFLVELNPTRSDSPGERYTETRNPYKGLAAFHERDAVDFYGRTSVTGELCRALGRSHLLAIIGPSGVGKSSVARAGLIPALRSGALTDSDQWVITDMLPGSHPFLELQRALSRVALDLPVRLTEALAGHDPRSLAGIESVLPEGADLVVLVDQFEELFTMVGETERQAFLDLIEATVTERSARFVLTLRADFLDRPLRYSGFGGLLKTSAAMLASPGPSELAEAIAEPASGVGVEISPGLVERMVNEVRDQPGALPLLQHTLAELFASRSSDLIDLDNFDAIGGVSGSLSQSAESIYSQLPEEERATVKQEFLRLVTIVEESAPTRRRVRLTDLADLDAEETIEKFVTSRLLVLDSDPETRTPTVEVAHEALLTHWPRLAGWVDAAREDLMMVRRLDENIRDWEDSDRNDAYLLTGTRLARHEAWTSTTTLTLGKAHLDYLSASRQHDQQLSAGARRRRNLVMGGFAAAAVIASIVGIYALVQRSEATANAADAQVRALTQASLNDAVDDPELAVLLAAEAVDIARSGEDLPPETRGALWTAYTDNRLIDRFNGVGFRAVAFSPDGGLLAVDSAPAEGGTVTLFDSQTRDIVGSLQLLDNGSIRSTWQIAWSPDGSLIAVARGGSRNGHGIIEVFSTETLERVTSLGEGGFIDYTSVDFADDGALVGLGWIEEGENQPASLTMWNPATAEELAHVPVDGVVATVRTNFFPGSHDLIVGIELDDEGQGGDIRMIDLDTGETTVSVPFDGWPGEIVLSPDGSMLAVGDNANKTIDVFDTETWQPIVGGVEHGDPQRVIWSADSSQLAVSGNDADVTILNMPDGDHYLLAGHGASVFDSSFHPSADLVASVSVEGEVRLWDVSQAGPVANSVTLGSHVPFQLLSVGDHVVTNGGYLARVDTGEVVQAADEDVGAVAAKEAELYALIGEDGTAGLYEIDGQLAVELPNCSAPLAVSPDARYLVSDWREAPGFCNEDHRHVELIDLTAGETLFDLGDRFVWHAVVTPSTAFDGKVYAAFTVYTTPNTNVVEIWALDTARKIAVIDSSMVEDLPFIRVSSSPSGRYLGIGTNGPRSAVVDLERLVGGDPIVDAIVFNRQTHSDNAPYTVVTDDGLVGTGGADGYYRWWDLASGDLVFEVRTDAFPAHDFSIDGRYYLYQAAPGVIRRIPTDIDEMVSEALGSVIRDFTLDECQRYQIADCEATAQG